RRNPSPAHPDPGGIGRTQADPDPERDRAERGHGAQRDAVPGLAREAGVAPGLPGCAGVSWRLSRSFAEHSPTKGPFLCLSGPSLKLFEGCMKRETDDEQLES